MTYDPMEADLQRQRSELIKTLQRQGISDFRVLETIATVPREEFVPATSRALAYDNNAMGIGHGQTISQPYIVALMTQELKLTGRERVLEIGTGCGYQAAILAQLASAVYTIERIPELSARAQKTLKRLGVGNVHYLVGDGTVGWPEEAPFDRIIVTAASRDVPIPLAEQLAEGGILVMPVGSEGHQSLRAYTKEQDRLYDQFLCECRFVRLVGAEGWPE